MSKYAYKYLLKCFIDGYIAALLWSSGKEYDSLGIGDISNELKFRIIKDAINFIILAKEDNLLGENSYEQAGHDFALTRNGCGAGFWDGDWSVNGDKLTQLSHKFGECDLYIGDDNLIYC